MKSKYLSWRKIKSIVVIKAAKDLLNSQSKINEIHFNFTISDEIRLLILLFTDCDHYFTISDF